MKHQSNKHRIVMIGVDSLDVDLFQQWAAAGQLPFLNSLQERGAMTRMSSTHDMFNDSPWPSFNSGVSPAKHAFYNHLQLKRGTTQIERINAHHCRHLPFWSHLKHSGKKIATFDVPKTFPMPGLEGIQISAWGEHYPLLHQPTSEPSSVIDHIVARYGKYPHPLEIPGLQSVRQERRIAKLLQSNLDRKLRATRELLEQDDWDLFFAVFSEFHYSGHQFHHHACPDHWAHEPRAPEDLKAAMPGMAQRVDRALETLLGDLPGSTTCFVLSVHGFAPNYTGNHLMNDVLERLGYLTLNQQPKTSGTIASILHTTGAIRNLIPSRLRDYINLHFVPESVHDQVYTDEFSSRIDWTKTRAFFLPSDHFQAFISVNRRGREPQGTVEPGADFDAQCTMIQNDLRALVNPDTGRPAVIDVVRTADMYRGPNLLELPDLVVRWASDAPIQRVSHPRLGVIDRGNFTVRKTQHAADGFIIAAGKHIQRDARLSGVSTLDVAPTILHLLGQPIPGEMDGAPLLDLFDDEFAHRVQTQSGLSHQPASENATT